ncbi:MAG: hypothetical protein AAF564_24055 [Bacteroidota bacterium]
MIGFFRKLRKKLLQEGELRKYLVYAFGEIILVVLGILIALQVNNWNIERQTQQEAADILVTVLDEMTANAQIVSGCQAELGNLVRAADSLRTLTGADYSNLAIESATWLLGSVGAVVRCPVQTDVIDELRSSGNLRLISDADLRRAIGRWTTALKELGREEDEWSREFSTQYYPYTAKWMSWEEFEYYLNPDNPQYYKARKAVDPRPVLHELEFANLLALHYWRMGRIEDRQAPLMQRTTEISVLIQKIQDAS